MVHLAGRSQRGRARPLYCLVITLDRILPGTAVGAPKSEPPAYGVDCARSCSGRTGSPRRGGSVRVSLSGRRSSGSFGSDRTAGYAIGEERTSPWLEAITGVPRVAASSDTNWLGFKVYGFNNV